MERKTQRACLFGHARRVDRSVADSESAGAFAARVKRGGLTADGELLHAYFCWEDDRIELRSDRASLSIDIQKDLAPRFSAPNGWFSCTLYSPHSILELPQAAGIAFRRDGSLKNKHDSKWTRKARCCYPDKFSAVYRAMRR